MVVCGFVGILSSYEPGITLVWREWESNPGSQLPRQPVIRFIAQSWLIQPSHDDKTSFTTAKDKGQSVVNNRSENDIG